jgi:single-stranded-DNA-specific exonuclease
MSQPPSLEWRIAPEVTPPEWFRQALHQYLGTEAPHAATLLWQRSIRSVAQLGRFLDPQAYQPASPFEFGTEMEQAVARLQKAHKLGEKVAIWGDFDADGLTATAVLWEGLGRLLEPHVQLCYYIPNRLTESHGLSIRGINQLKTQGCQLIVTCDTGSSNLLEIDHAQHLGIDVIVTDHHTLPSTRPPVTAIVNPRTLPPEHPLANLSGVAVAYKLVEALYQTLDIPSAVLESLLDLVAIGLITDLVELTGDCRYLAQRGIERLQHHLQMNLPERQRPGIAYLLEWCKRSGDRPTDISFGIGPRINAISRIQGDAHYCIELLTSQDAERCQFLAEQTELANARRKALQRQVFEQVKSQIAQMDLSTTRVIVLVDPQWSVGVLGLVAGQVAQEYGRPTILLSIDGETSSPEPDSSSYPNLSGERDAYPTIESSVGETGKMSISPIQPIDLNPPKLARGSARSVNRLDLYALVQTQAHWLHHFGGHPLAMGLSLPVENIPLFAEAINRQMRELVPIPPNPLIQADLTVTVADLGQALFRELKLLEPCGMGNPVPRLCIRNCWFTEAKHQNIADAKQQKLRYIKTSFQLQDDSTTAGFPGVWWGHYRDEIPPGRCDAIVELDFNPYQDPKKRRQPRYEVRLIAVRSTISEPIAPVAAANWLLDWRNPPLPGDQPNAVVLHQCPTSWDELHTWCHQSRHADRPLALAYDSLPQHTPVECWQQWVGLAKYLSRTGQIVTRNQLCQRLGCSPRLLDIGLKTLTTLGMDITALGNDLQFSGQFTPSTIATHPAITEFLSAAREAQFQQHYFHQLPLATMQDMIQGEMIPRYGDRQSY